jgi:hypothetical protein
MRIMASLSYDDQEDIFAIRLRDEPIARTVEFDDGVHLVDVDAEGRPVRIEVLDAEEADLDLVGQRFDLPQATIDELKQLVRDCVPTSSRSDTPTVWGFAHMQIRKMVAPTRSESRSLGTELELILS